MNRAQSAACILALLTTTLAPVLAEADQVTLRTKDGLMEFEGELLNFDGSMYTLKTTTMGVARFPVEQVECEGAGCPLQQRQPDQPQVETSDVVTVALGPDIESRLITDLLEAYGVESGANVTIKPDAGGRTEVSVDGPAGAFEAVLSPASSGPRSPHVTIGYRAGRPAPNVADEQVIAVDPIVAIASPDLRLSSVSLDNLAGLYAGRFASWSDLGLENRPVRVVLDADEEGSSAAVNDILLGGGQMATSVERVDDVGTFVRSERGVIGMSGFHDRGVTRALLLAGSCGLTTSPDSFSVKSGHYPFVRLMTVRWSQPLPPGLADFVDFTGSSAAQDVLASQGYFDQTIEVAGMAFQGDWMATAFKFAEFLGSSRVRTEALERLSKLTRSGKRLSTTFRGVFGSEADDAATREAYERLAALLATGGFDGSEIVFAGFTDASNSPANDVSRAGAAAALALDAFLSSAPDLRGRAGLSFTSTGYGGIAPLVCDSDTIGGIVNKRVEVWVRSP